MNEFWKATALVLISVILCLTVGKREKDLAILLSMTACCLVAGVMLFYISPIVDFVKNLEAVANLQNGFLSILLKSVGIALVAELAEMICKDAENASLGKMIQLLGSVVIVSFSIPVLQSFLSMVQEILGNL